MCSNESLLLQRVASGIPGILGQFVHTTRYLQSWRDARDLPGPNSDLVMTLPRRIVNTFADRRRIRTFTPPIAIKNFDVVMASEPRSVAAPPVLWFQDVIREVATEIRKSAPQAQAARR